MGPIIVLYSPHLYPSTVGASPPSEGALAPHSCWTSPRNGTMSQQRESSGIHWGGGGARNVCHPSALLWARVQYFSIYTHVVMKQKTDTVPRPLQLLNLGNCRMIREREREQKTERMKEIGEWKAKERKRKERRRKWYRGFYEEEGEERKRKRRRRRGKGKARAERAEETELWFKEREGSIVRCSPAMLK